MDTPKILIVEDEQVIAADIEDCLIDFGYEVIGSVRSGEEALSLVGEHRPDLTLMDINLDGNLNGTEVAKIFRDRYEIPVVYLTAHADDETLSRVKSTIPLGFILKPFNERELRSAVDIALYREAIERNTSAKLAWRKQAIENTGDGVIATDENYRIKFMNCAAEKLTGWFFSEAHEKHIADVLRFTRSDASQVIKDFPDRQSRSNNTGCIHISDINILQSDQKSQIPVDVIGTPIVGRSDEWMGMVLVLRDVRSRWLHAEDSKLQQRELLSEKLDALNELLGGLAHGINNSLAGSIGFLELLRRNDKIEEDFARYADMAISGCKDASSLINKVRFSCSSAPVNVSRLDLDDVVADVVGKLSNRIGDNIEIDYLRADSRIWIQGDRSQITEAIVRVLINAALAVTKGGNITVRCGQEYLLNQDVPTLPSAQSGYGVISIKDTGIGIEPEVLNKIFDPFYTTLKDGKVYGRGLGLTLAYGIMKGHKGWINVESIKGKGSTFSLYFPIVE